MAEEEALLETNVSRRNVLASPKLRRSGIWRGKDASRNILTYFGASPSLPLASSTTTTIPAELVWAIVQSWNAANYGNPNPGVGGDATSRLIVPLSYLDRDGPEVCKPRGCVPFPSCRACRRCLDDAFIDRKHIFGGVRSVWVAAGSLEVGL